ncbi:carboxypeptidase-like regulatory domain-containing protein [Wenyingzhuangia sp. IMCC45533]
MKIKSSTYNLRLKNSRTRFGPRTRNILRLSLFACFFFSILQGYSQKKISLNVQNSTLESIINQIEQQTDYTFVLNNDIVNVSKKYSLRVANVQISDALTALFENSEIEFIIKKQYIVLSKKSKEEEQNNLYTLSGVVTSKESGETLMGVSVFTEKERKGTVTNDYGFYSITLPKGNYVFNLSYLGYTSQKIKINLTSNIQKSIELESFLNELDKVVIMSDEADKSQVKNIETGKLSLTSSEIKKLPSFLGEPDINRAVLTQPGISAVGEGTTGFNVRGGNIDQNLILLDEAPLYYSSHLFGLFSIYNTDAIKYVNLYKGGIPAEYGGRASSVLDVRQKNGNNKRFKGEGGVGLLFSRLTLEGPIKKDKVSFLLSGRRSYFDIFIPVASDGDQSKFYFYDLNTKLSWDLNKKNKIYASAFLGKDVIKADSADEGEEENTSLDLSLTNITTTLRWNHIFSDKLFANITGVYSKYDFGFNVEIDESNQDIQSLGTNRSIHNWIFKPDFTYYADPTLTMKFGMNTTFYEFVPEKPKGNLVDDDVKFDKGNALELSAYYSVKKEWEKLSLQAGLRYSWFADLGRGEVAIYNPNLPQTLDNIIGTKKYDQNEIIKSYGGLEPRLALKYDFNDRKAIKFGYNRMFQYIHLISNTTLSLPFDTWRSSGKYIKPLEVNQISAGYAYDTPNKGYNFSVEAYYKTLNNIVEYRNGARFESLDNIETDLVAAKGIAYGLELAAHKNFGRLTGNMNYTHSLTKRKTTSAFAVEQINEGRYYNSDYDRPHVFNFTLNYNLSEKWKLGTFFTYQTGRPVTQPNGKIEINGKPTLTYSDRNAFRLPDAHRMDVVLTCYPKKNANRRWQGSWSFGVYNLYGQKNAFSNSYSFEEGMLKTKQFSLIPGAIPFATYNFKF